MFPAPYAAALKFTSHAGSKTNTKYGLLPSAAGSCRFCCNVNVDRYRSAITTSSSMEISMEILRPLNLLIQF
jgi:hypothetical protein